MRPEHIALSEKLEAALERYLRDVGGKVALVVTVMDDQSIAVVSTGRADLSQATHVRMTAVIEAVRRACLEDEGVVYEQSQQGPNHGKVVEREG